VLLSKGSRIGLTYPEISRSGIEVEIDSLRGGTNRNWAKVHGVILLVFRANLASLCVSSGGSRLPFRQYLVGCSLAADLVHETVVTRLRYLVHLEVWTRLGGLEAPSVEKVDIGLRA
jgi:hypothetical protein